MKQDYRKNSVWLAMAAGLILLSAVPARAGGPPHEDGFERAAVTMNRWIETTRDVAVQVRDSGGDAMEELQSILRPHIINFDQRLDEQLVLLREFLGDANTPAEIIARFSNFLTVFIHLTFQWVMDNIWSQAQIPGAS